MFKLIILCSFIGVTFTHTFPLTEDYSSNIFGLIRHCIRQNEIVKCMKKQAVIVLDNVIQNNESWSLNDYISIKRDPGWISNTEDEINTIDDSELDNILKTKINNLAESRMIQFKISPDPIEEGESARKSKRRKKKEKGGMMMLSGMAIMAMILQLVLGKIAFLAGAAIIIAKISLLFSLLSGLKKMMGGNSGGEHVVLATEHGHGSSGWQRSINPVNATPQSLAFSGYVPEPLDNNF